MKKGIISLLICICATLSFGQIHIAKAAESGYGVKMITGGSVSGPSDGDYRKLVLKENGELWTIGKKTTTGFFERSCCRM